MSKIDASNCLCDDPNHDLCWDGWKGIPYNPECECCRDTASDLYMFDPINAEDLIYGS